MFSYLLEHLPSIALLVSGIFAFVRWLAERRRELAERRFAQYLQLIQSSQRSKFLAEQRVSILLLKRYPEFRDETVAFLQAATETGGEWATNNKVQIDSTLGFLAKRG